MRKNYETNFKDITKIYYNDLKLNSKPLSREDELVYIKNAKNGDVSAREKLLNANLRNVFNVCKNFSSYGVEMEDLISEGNVGLIEALDKFDEERTEIRFFSYAVHWVKAYIIRFITSANKNAQIELSQEQLLSLNNNVNEAGEEDEKLENVNLFENVESAVSEIKKEKQEKLIEDIISTLEEREKKIVMCWFGLGEYDEMNLDEIGNMIGLSRERVRQVKDTALLKMRSYAALIK
jgi:RNA polymerase primary sigma factor